MKIKAIDHIEDYNQHPIADGRGGYTLQTVCTKMVAGEVYDLPDDQAQRLLTLGCVSTDMDAPLHPSLIPGGAVEVAPEPAVPAQAGGATTP